MGFLNDMLAHVEEEKAHIIQTRLALLNEGVNPEAEATPEQMKIAEAEAEQWANDFLRHWPSASAEVRKKKDE
jgi:hypothetical protein